MKAITRKRMIDASGIADGGKREGDPLRAPPERKAKVKVNVQVSVKFVGRWRWRARGVELAKVAEER